MYDQTGDNITAYTFELNKGYIVVAAYIDAPELIPEWSDDGQPVYKNFNLDADDKVVFLGVFDYFEDNGTDSLNSIYGDVVSRSEINNIFEDARSIENIRDDLLADIVEEKCLEATDQSAVALFGEITDPYAHAAQTIYGGSWTAVDWANNWENHAWFATMSQFSGYQNHCGPTANVNLIKMYGQKYNNSTIKNAFNSNVFFKVMDTNNTVSPRYYINGSPGGTDRSRADAFIRGSFAQYGVTVYTYGLYSATYTNIKNCTSATNKLMFLGISNHSYYAPTDTAGHAVVGYAYTRLQSNNYPYIYKPYVKIADGWATGARYIDIGDLLNGSSFWEVYFN